jgi:tripartite-type tricarboxylate transporter receptor subunit TctC
VLNHGGTVKGIAMMTKERSKVLPNVPTGIEQGGGVRCLVIRVMV